VVVRPAVFNGDIATLDVAGLSQAALKGENTIRLAFRRGDAKKPDDRHCRLLRSRPERPTDNSVAEQH
jgi:hypothetical protein